MDRDMTRGRSAGPEVGNRDVDSRISSAAARWWVATGVGDAIQIKIKLGCGSVKENPCRGCAGTKSDPARRGTARGPYAGSSEYFTPGSF